jgi:hypothetical protein
MTDDEFISTMMALLERALPYIPHEGQDTLYGDIVQMLIEVPSAAHAKWIAEEQAGSV